MDLHRFFADHPHIALAFSGGTDSAFVLYAAKKYGARVKAYYVKTPFQPQFEYDDAVRLTQELKIPLQTIELDILEDPVIASNPHDRCYFCKKRIFSAIVRAAKDDGFDLIADGTNASDDEADRPGMRVLEEMKILSPLLLCGLTKGDVRQASKDAGLFTHDKPAYACLATRVPTGTPITKEILARAEASEAFLRGLGFSDFRVRLLDGAARLQLRQSQLDLLMEKRSEVLSELQKYYPAVLLDLEVRQ